MAYARKKLPEEETRKLFKDGRKKFVRVDEGAALYSMGIHAFRDLATDAGAVYRLRRTVLINTDIINEYLENFREE